MQRPTAYAGSVVTSRSHVVSDAAGEAVVALAERLVREPPSAEDAAILQKLHDALRADPTTFRETRSWPAPVSLAELMAWQPLVQSGAFALAPSASAVAASTAEATGNARKRKRTDNAAVAVVPALAAPVPRLVRELSALWAYSASIETIELRRCALTPNAVALLCAALSGIERHSAALTRMGKGVGGGLRALTIEWNDAIGVLDGVAADHPGAWYIAQYLRANASLRRLSVASAFPLSATDLADVCDALLLRRDEFGATLERLDISQNPVFARPPPDPPAPLQTYRHALSRIAAFGALNAADDRMSTVSADGARPRRCHFPAALQCIAMHSCPRLSDALTTLRPAGRGALRNGDPLPAEALTSLQVLCREWSSKCAELMAEWVSGADCTLQSVASQWVPSHWPDAMAAAPLSGTVERCALFANASLTELTVAGDAGSVVLTNAEFVVLLAAVRTHPRLRAFTISNRTYVGDSYVDAAPGAFTVALSGAFPAPCAVMLSRFAVLDADDSALPVSARVQAVAELLAFGADHLEELSVTGMERLVNGTHIALAQRWVDDGTRHCDVSNPVRDFVARDKPLRDKTVKRYASADAIRGRLSAAPEVARISSLKRLTIECDIAALIALRTALAPPNGLLSRSLEELTLEAPNFGAGNTLGTQTDDPANPWVVYSGTVEAPAAFEAAGRLTLSEALAALLRDGLRHNTALTSVNIDARGLIDAVITAGLLPLLMPRRHATRSTGPVGGDPLQPNRTLRRVEFLAASFSASCLPVFAALIANAKAHGLRELWLKYPAAPLPPHALQRSIVRALTALQRAGNAHFAFHISDFAFHISDALSKDPVRDLIHAMSWGMKRRARHARRQWARVAVVMASFRAIATRNGLANSVQPLLPVIAALAAL